MKKSTIKNAEIKIRIREQDKGYIQKCADKQGVPLSDYIRSICLNDNNSRIQLMPDAVETWNAYNEILRAVKSTGNQNLSETIESIINKHLPKATNEKRRSNEQEQK
jgi:hypothetical protein